MADSNVMGQQENLVIKHKSSEQHLKHFTKLITALSKEDNYRVKSVDSDIYYISPQPSKKTNKSIALVALTHGDEVIGLHILNEFILKILEKKLILNGDLYLILANRDAYLKNQRYLDVDLNRVYGKKLPSTLIEEKRVQKIKPIIDKCDYIVDIHQSIEDTLHPFFILPYTDESYRWVSQAAPNIPVIFQEISNKVTTLSSYGTAKGKMAVTFEVGGSGVDVYQLELGSNVVQQFVELAHGSPQVANKHHLRSHAPVYNIQHFEPYKQGRVQFSKKFVNFESVTKGQTIALVDDKVVKSPMEGKIILYPRKWFSPDSTSKADGLFFILKEG